MHCSDNERYFNIDTVNAPSAVKNVLRTFSSIKFIRQDSKGASGYLFFGKNIVTGLDVAVKFYRWDGDRESHAEPAILASLNSSNIVRILDAQLVDQDFAYFITPYLSNGDLDDYIGGGIRGNKHAVKLTRDILKGLSCLHSKRIIHRDLKPQNIFVSKQEDAMIGDFGSVKQIPKNKSTVMGSGHTILYQPPETFINNRYDISGDLYQVGILLYQLLGGLLSYELTDWLSQSELRQYTSYDNPVDRQIFGNQCLIKRIKKGNILDMTTLPPWVCNSLKRTISKACNVKPEKRFQSCSQFLAHLGNINDKVHDWQIIDGLPTYKSKISFRIRKDNKECLFVEKMKNSKWRRCNEFTGGDFHDIVQQIENIKK